MLQASGLTLTYTTGDTRTNALDHVDLNIEAGEFVGIVGPSGSGKSSLLYLLAGLRLPTGGQVHFQGQMISGMSANERAALRQRHFGFIFQQHFLIDYLSALENVLVALPHPSPDDRRRGVEILTTLGLADHLRKRPHQLSGGQRQRVAAARSIMHRPDVVFADEPTASLDHATAFELMRVIRELRATQHSALVVVTHDPSILTGADRVVQMWDGRIRGETPGSPMPNGSGATLSNGLASRAVRLSPSTLRSRRQLYRASRDALATVPEARDQGATAPTDQAHDRGEPVPSVRPEGES